MSSPDLADLLPSSYKSLITSWLAEDCPSLDPGGYVVGSSPRTATLFAKSKGILAGLPFFTEVFTQCGCTVAWHLSEGATVAPTSGNPVRVATVSGPTRQLLLGERVALNALARCSGVATASSEMVELVRGAGYTGILAGTRKTTPGFRVVEKYGMLVGGADAHRHDLSSMIMLKDNHIWARGSITEAVKAARKVGGFALKIEVEVDSEEGADEAIEAGADVVMLDNFGGEGLKVAAKAIRGRWEGKKGVLLECSGGLTRENVREYVCNGKMGDLSIGCRTLANRGRYRYHLDERDSPGCATCRFLPQNRSLEYANLTLLYILFPAYCVYIAYWSYIRFHIF